MASGRPRTALRGRLPDADQVGMIGVYFALGMLTVAILWLIFTYNGLVKSRNKVDEAWSGIDVQLKRRHDLVPNLVETVEGYAVHERETLAALTRARAEAMDAGDASRIEPAEARLTSALGQVEALAEAYPTARGLGELQAPSGRASRNRGRDPGSAPHLPRERAGLQHAHQVFPNNLIAGSMSFRAREFLEIDVVRDHAVPQVVL